MGQQAAAVTAPSGDTTTDYAMDADNSMNPSFSQGSTYTANNDASNALKTAGAATSFVPILGLGLTLASTVMSSMEAQKARNAENAAKRDAARAAEEMKRLTAQNEYAAIQVPVQAYERAFREGTASNAEAINALAQDPRTLIGGIQGVQEATIEGQAKNTEALADRLYNDSMTKAGVRAGINQNLAKIAAGEVSGAQIAAMAAEKAKIAQQQAMLQGVGGLITQGAGMIGTYGNLATPEDRLSGLNSSLKNTMFAPKQENTTQAIMQLIKNNPALLAQLTQTS